MIDVKNKARECGISGPPSRLFTADIEQTDERELELNADPTEAVNELEEDLGTDVEPREEPKSADEDVDKDVFIEQDTGRGGRRRRGSAKPPSHGKVHCYSRGTNFLANELELNTDPVEAVNELEDDLVQTKSTNSRHLLSTQTTSGGRACGIYRCYTVKILTIKPFFKTTKNLFCFSCNSPRKESVKVCPAKKG